MAEACGEGGVSNGKSDNSIPVATDYYKYVFGRTIAALKHDPGLSYDWSPDENSLIQHLFTKYASESIITKYAKIVQHLNDETIRDVILYHKKINEIKTEKRKRRRDNDNSSRQNKHKKEEVADPLVKSSSHLTNRSNDNHHYAQTAVSMESDDGISYKAIGGATGRLLELNAQAMNQISANFRSFKIHDNVNLFCQAQNNILSILKDLKDVPEVMKQMPPLPVKLNEELCRNLLPPPSLYI